MRKTKIYTLVEDIPDLDSNLTVEDTQTYEKVMSNIQFKTCIGLELLDTLTGTFKHHTVIEPNYETSLLPLTASPQCTFIKAKRKHLLDTDLLISEEISLEFSEESYEYFKTLFRQEILMFLKVVIKSYNPVFIKAFLELRINIDD